MITKFLLDLVFSMVAVLFAPITLVMAPMIDTFNQFIEVLGNIVVWLFSVGSYFFHPELLRAAVLYIPMYYSALLITLLVRCVINLIRGSGA